MHGCTGIGIVKNNETAGANVVVEIADAYWAPGVWGGAENMKLDVYNAGLTTLRNVTSGDATVSKVDFDNKTITISSLSANLTAGDIIFPAGAFGKQMKGLHYIASNTSQDLFGISAASYNLWKATQFNANPSAPTTPVVLTHAVVQQAIAKGVAKGLKGDVVCMVNPSHWDNLLTDEAALRVNLDGTKQTDTYYHGAKSIKFACQTGGIVEIRPSLYVMEGRIAA